MRVLVVGDLTKSTLWSLKSGQEMDFVFRSREAPVTTTTTVAVWKYEPAEGPDWAARRQAGSLPGPFHYLVVSKKVDGPVPPSFLKPRD
jgi:hypothetical protein